jgi:hypothetical protein
MLILSGLGQPVLAGMPGVSLSDFGALRLQGISFFALAFVICSWVVRQVWNGLQRDFPRLPRLSFGKALGVVFLWGLLFVLVLTMISGARELMTPGAWVKNGSTYRLADTTARTDDPSSGSTLIARREIQIQRLWSALVLFAARHERRFPSATEAVELDETLWQLPDRQAARFYYVAGPDLDEPERILAYEPAVYGDDPFVLMSSGKIMQMSRQLLRDKLTAGPVP